MGTWDNFVGQLDTPEMRAYFKAIDLDPSEARGLFRLLDMDDSGTINAEEFLNGRMHSQFDAHLNAVEHELLDSNGFSAAMDRPWAKGVSEGFCSKVLEHGSIAGMIEVDHFHTGSTTAPLA